MTRPVRKLLLCLSLAAAMVSASLQPSLAAAVDLSSNPHVLFLSAYSYEWESIPLQLAGITDTLNGLARVDYVFMDTKRMAYADVREDVYTHIARHAANDPYDYIIAGDDAALQFVLEYRDTLFADIPVVFEGINNEAFAHEAAEDPLMTGIVETFPLEETLALASAMNPSAGKVVAITDNSVSGRGSTAQLLNCQSSFPEMEFSLINCSEMTCEEIGEAVSACGEDTLLLFLMMSADRLGNTYTNTEAVEYITACAKVPVYKADELGLGDGICGGVVVSYKAMTTQAAEIVLALAGGKAITAFPVCTADTYCAFDRTVMARFGMKKADIAAAYAGKVSYLHDTVSFFQQHSSILIPGGIIILLLLILCILSILVARSKRRYACQLQERERMLNSLLDTIPGGLAIYRVRGLEQGAIETLYSSQGIPRLSGRTMEEYREWIKGGLFTSTVMPRDLPAVQKALAASVPAKRPCFVQYHLLGRDGRPVPVSLSATWGYDEKDGSSIYYAVYMDNTEQEKARRAEREAIEARASSNVKSKFLSEISHDIRTPLNAVLGFAALALDEPGVPENTLEYLEKINLSGKYLLGLINDVLDMSKIDSGKITLTVVSVDWLKMLENTAEPYRAQAKEKGIRLVTDFDVSQAPWVMMDELRTRQIYANLLSNAIKFSESGTEIHWSVRGRLTPRQTVHTLCTIQDQGCGMKPEFMQNIFEPFEQGDSAFAKEGTGLGLSIVKSLLHLMGGTIRVESTPGQGSVFIFELERAVGTPTADSIKAAAVSPELLQGCRVLLCEDNRLNTMVAQRLLEKAGCTVDTAENGEIGRDRFAASAPGYYSAILMDIRMPVLDGLAAARAIRALDRPDAGTVPIVAMSANAFDEDVKASLAAGMNAHLAKPVEPDKLYAVLVELTQKGKAL